MKKSQLRNIIRGVINEQGSGYPYPNGAPNEARNVVFQVCPPATLIPVGGSGVVGNQFTQCMTIDGQTPQLGQTFSMADAYSNVLGMDCNNYPTAGYCIGKINMVPHSITHGDCNCYTYWNGNICQGYYDHPSIPDCGQGPTQAGSCNASAWSNHANWTNTFTNTVANHNNPCTFLNTKIAQFTSNLQGTGQGGYQNVQNCKLDLANQLHTSNNC